MMRRTSSLPLRAASQPIPRFRSRPTLLRCEPRPLTQRFLQLRHQSSVSASHLSFGQPLHETHPHLLAPGELTPGISALEYHHRRAALAQKLPRNSCAILASNDLKYRSGPVFYEFHQDPNFFYLTGFNEPDSVAVIARGGGGRGGEYTFTLFVRPKDEQAEKWDGARSGVQAAKDVWNADEAYDIGDVERVLGEIVDGKREVYTDIGLSKRKSAFERFFAGRRSKPATEGFAKVLQHSTVKPLRPIMNGLRITKSDAELDNMRKAGAISGAVITEAMKSTYRSEKQLWADLAYGFKSQDLDGEAYIPVVGGGTNGLSIHYTANNALLQPGEMVLVDAGGEYGNYITDITRTWPVNGRFTGPQRDMYSMILNAQKSCISMCREDADMSLDKLHKIAETSLKNGLKDLGFDTSHPDTMDTLFPHHVGHYIGLDVHDAPGHPRTERLKENQCITIEPGIYVPPDDERWPKHFRGLGIRIEDSLRIGKEKVEVMTSTAVKEVGDIEALR